MSILVFTAKCSYVRKSLVTQLIPNFTCEPIRMQPVDIPIENQNEYKANFFTNLLFFAYPHIFQRFPCSKQYENLDG